MLISLFIERTAE